MLLFDLNRLEKSLKNYEDLEALVIQLFWFCSRLLGYDFVKGRRYFIPFYYQNPSQYYGTVQSLGQDDREVHKEDTKNVITKQRELVQKLQNDGLNDFKIALVMNTTEYQIKKIKNDL
jgi:hypothetical protein